jgi:septum formation topological specificity factor MinE
MRGIHIQRYTLIDKAKINFKKKKKGVLKIRQVEIPTVKEGLTSGPYSFSL